MYELTVNNVSKSFAKKVALNNVSLKVRKGSIFGLIGPNGAGKSTLTSILATLTLPNEGTVEISNLDVVSKVNKVRKKVGVTFQQTTVFSTGTAWENLWIAGKMYGMSTTKIMERGEHLLKEFDLFQASNDLVDTYSGGMKRKLDIAISLLHTPDILLLDEPTAGLDPESRTTLWQIVTKISQDEGTTIFVTTHYLEELNHLATEIALINNGKILDIGTPKELINKLAADQIEIHYRKLDLANIHKIEAYISNLKEIVRHEIKPTVLTIMTSHGQQILSELLKYLIQSNVEIKFSELKQATLNDVYLANFNEKEAEL
ncbi:ATP-binding cassette domain-containing protein [Agaribacter marinus]|uniref:ATP-binding cassette domain-containing protein n=1 Tax=Virgibacillus salarius TaxID=447199 RepID=A0A941IBF6_9BACI|nr:ATP-binding cassette domain-containing protein [Virgibacillus salarius]MBR7796381.1 ATP-binding cassette domain-containing protein [Virgibacillus salarius]NAZ09090.1 ATP-binding cassette domain-containing protein [Agaribacter marinus]WBX80575.1 ATP-binding cassette domain-containing protein [Virgibacillus salarius]